MDNATIPNSASILPTTNEDEFIPASSHGRSLMVEFLCFDYHYIAHDHIHQVSSISKSHKTFIPMSRWRSSISERADI
jgi:hypothetical protein